MSMRYFAFPIPSWQVNWIVFARRIHSTSQFAMTILSKSVCVCLFYVDIFFHPVKPIATTASMHEPTPNSNLKPLNILGCNPDFRTFLTSPLSHAIEDTYLALQSAVTSTSMQNWLGSWRCAECAMHSGCVTFCFFFKLFDPSAEHVEYEIGIDFSLTNSNLNSMLKYFESVFAVFCSVLVVSCDSDKRVHRYPYTLTPDVLCQPCADWVWKNWSQSQPMNWKSE